MTERYPHAFWESDFTSQSGFETLLTHMKSGRHTCKEFEDYLKQRAKIEEEYGKALLKIAKTDRGLSEVGTIRKSFENFRSNAELEANSRLNFHTLLMEEANKLSTFREKQKEEAKTQEEAVRKTHKLKAEQYRKMNSNKTTYESKCKAADKADSDLERMKFNNKPKEVDKARKNTITCRQSMEKADHEYKNSVQLLETYRLKWISDHVRTCEVYEELDIERFKYLRNAMWVFSNLLSDVCVESDRNCEANRNSLELIDIDSDLELFVREKGKSFGPLKQISYMPYCETSLQNVNATTHTNNHVESEYQSVNFTPRPNGNGIRHKAIYDYTAQNPEEIDLHIGDEISVSLTHEDGWSDGRNKTNGQRGLFPTTYIQPL